MKRDLTVVRYGTDTSGRAIWMTKWMILVFRAILRHPDVAPFAHKVVIVQGAFMVRNGGGAAASAGYHDQGGCLDLRTWNLSLTELNALVRVFRMFGFALWRRDESWVHGGMDPHAHGTLGSDGPLSSGAKTSWGSYLNKGDGLAGGRPDYEWRPSPLVVYPPVELLEQDYLMSDAAERKLDDVLAGVKRLEEDLDTFRSGELKRDRLAAQKARESKKQLVSAIGGVVDALVEVSNKTNDAATKTQLRKVRDQLLKALADDPDVDGPENPA